MDSLVWIALAAFIGALGSGMAGFWDSYPEPFNARKFMGTVWRAVTAGLLFALTAELTKYTGWALYISAILGGAGIDALGNRLQGGVVAREPLANKMNQLHSDIDKAPDKRTSEQKGEPSA